MTTLGPKHRNPIYRADRVPKPRVQSSATRTLHSDSLGRCRCRASGCGRMRCLTKPNHLSPRPAAGSLPPLQGFLLGYGVLHLGPAPQGIATRVFPSPHCLFCQRVRWAGAKKKSWSLQPPCHACPLADRCRSHVVPPCLGPPGRGQEE